MKVVIHEQLGQIGDQDIRKLDINESDEPSDDILRGGALGILIECSKAMGGC